MGGWSRAGPNRVLQGDLSDPEVGNQGTSNQGWLLCLKDGSIAADGYFEGLDCTQARGSLKLVQEEYKRYLNNLSDTNCPDHQAIAASMNRVGLPPIASNSMQCATSATSAVLPVPLSQPVARHGEPEQAAWEQQVDDKDNKEYLEMHVFWGKRNWRRIFDLFQHYKGGPTLTLSAWNRLLQWVWSILGQEHMSEIQGIIQRLRSTGQRVPYHAKCNEDRVLRSLPQRNLICAYHKVIRSQDAQGNRAILQRFAIANLYYTYIAYITEFCAKVRNLQKAQ
ncbi:hypothetical protein C7212DRAFT_343003 [Tuber magnatum]|uniref:Uncharacterized protein n=1 Tax=Tuber magnatum TaxID=42249 RepID=A0A317SU99_9PEZI|nr:hypothetical protein C7212DRAFT_343003 [Tuber magnatum]